MGDDDAAEAYNADLTQLFNAVRGRGVAEAEALLRDWAARHAPYMREVDVQILARVMPDAKWARRHPAAALALAWNYRRSRPMRRSLGMLWRPRFAG
ncbi:hypothetical protein [Nocardioides silvaticus]|uniref:hypothetical protein n=1 Tax=Nocardioides silvaticus TaxID=2201891 RepID=UPI0011B1EF58|nr:hypothetical protein [Nocardioides silvaticus]